MRKPMVIDLFCGLGGWTKGFLEEGYSAVGFDCERHQYGEKRYPAQLVLQDVLTLHGSQFRNAAVIVASPPCQAYSYRAMPWKRAKELPPPSNDLFDACFRIQREACEAAGRYIPLVVENVCGAQKWVGRAKWHYGSYYLWGDVPALMPSSRVLKVPGFNFHQHENGGKGGSFQTAAVKVSGQDWNRHTLTGETSPHWRMQIIKGNGGGWFGDYKEQKSSGRGASSRQTSSHSAARKAASALIAEIPLPLARWIAQVYKPEAANA